MPKNLRKTLQSAESEERRAAPPPLFEWLFRQAEVPDGELIACTCWEYLREVRPENLGPSGYAGYARKLIFANRSHKAQRKFNDSFGHIPTNVFLHLARNPVVFDLPPWQSLDHALRQNINKPMPKAWGPLIEMDVISNDLISWILRMPDPGQFSVPRPFAEAELEVYALGRVDLARRKLLKEHDRSSEALPSDSDGGKVAKPGSRSINDFSVHDPRSWLIPYTSNGLASPVPFLINWGEYDKDEITAAFRDWIEAAHPRFAPAPRGKGTKVRDLRGALRHLGALRIISTMTADEFVMYHDENYLLFQQPWDGGESRAELPSVDLGKLRRRAIGFFQERFAADSGMKPRSWREPRTKKRTQVAPAGDLPDFKTKGRGKLSK